MSKYIEVISLVTSDEELVELVEVEAKTAEVISLVTSGEDENEKREEDVDVTDYDSDEEYWRQRKKKCPFILWECSEVVSVVYKCYVFFL